MLGSRQETWKSFCAYIAGRQFRTSWWSAWRAANLWDIAWILFEETLCESTSPAPTLKGPK